MNIDFFLAIDLISVAIATVACFYAWSFVVTYHHQPKWKSTVAGQHLMRFTRGLAIVLTWVVGGVAMRVLLPDHHDEWVDVVLSVGRIAIFAWLLAMLVERLNLLRAAIAQQEQVDDAYDSYLFHRGDGSTAERDYETDER